MLATALARPPVPYISEHNIMGPLGRGELIIRGGGGVSVLTENQESILRQCLSAADLASPTTRDLSRCWGDFVVAGWETPWGLYVPNKVAKLTFFGYVVRKNAGPWRQGTRVRCLARKKEKTKENGRLAIDLVGGSGVVALWSRRGVRSVFFFSVFPWEEPVEPVFSRISCPRCDVQANWHLFNTEMSLDFSLSVS